MTPPQITFFRRLVFLSDLFRNQVRSWNFKKFESGNEIKKKTSISDTSLYFDFCTLAGEDDQVFAKFRSCRQYQEILEHVDFNLGKKYLEVALENGLSLQEVKTLVEEDFGAPPKFSYGEIGRVSPTQLRYTKVLSEIELLFGNLSHANIVEIGVGYGGQAAQILHRHRVDSYLLVDLAPVVNLATRYIKKRVKIDPSILTRAVPSSEVDLLISNYAFSELTREIQEEYFERYILNSKSGYIIFNQFRIPGWDSWSAEEFLTRKSGSKITSEVPLTAKDNVLIVWGSKL